MYPLMTRIKQYWSRYRAWQRDPMHGRWVKEGSSADDAQGKQHRCANCGREYNGNYCPDCGQRHSVGRVTWNSIRQGVMELWGLGSRSLPYTLWQLVWRPGYLIGDYLRGRRQLSYPPIKMLVIVALFTFLVFNFSDDTAESTVVEITNFDSFFDQTMDWFLKHLDWLMLFLMSLFILPTYALFRYSPRCPKHTLPEGFFIQVFISSLLLMFFIVYTLIVYTLSSLLPSNWANSNAIYSVSYVAVSLLLLRVYKQLFGFGWWGTIWRLLLVLYCGAKLYGLTAELCYQFYSHYKHLPADNKYTFEHCVYSCLIALLLIAGCFIAAHAVEYIKKRLQR